jgi:hypothetical protein
VEAALSAVPTAGIDDVAKGDKDVGSRIDAIF